MWVRDHTACEAIKAHARLQKGQPVDCSLQRSTTAAVQPWWGAPQRAQARPHRHAARKGDPAVVLCGVRCPLPSLSHCATRSGRSSATVPRRPFFFLSAAQHNHMPCQVPFCILLMPCLLCSEDWLLACACVLLPASLGRPVQLSKYGLSKQPLP